MLAAALLTIEPDPLGRASVLTEAADHSGSLEVLRGFNPTAEQRSAYTFLMTANHFALNHRDDTAMWLGVFKDTFERPATRHAVLVDLMEEDLRRWKVGDLSDVGRDMGAVGAHLRSGRPDKGTRDAQAEIVRKLDRLIERARLAKLPRAEGDGEGDRVLPVELDSPGGGAHSGPGEATERKLRKLAESWGKLPPDRRAEAVREISRDTPPKYRSMIEQYFKSLRDSR